MTNDDNDNKKIIKLNQFRAIAQAEEATGLGRDISAFITAMVEAFRAAEEINNEFTKKAHDRALHGLEPNPCFNLVCEFQQSELTRNNYCKKEHFCHGCLFQMTSLPPSSLDYVEEIPNHQEALDILEANGLLKSDMQETLKQAQKYYNEKPKSIMARFEYIVNGLPMWQFEKAIYLVIQDLLEDEHIPTEHKHILYRYQPTICRSSLIEIEKALGIFPNLVLR